MDCRVKPGNDGSKTRNLAASPACYVRPIVPALVVKDTPKPR
jgi:hypothetical protein